MCVCVCQHQGGGPETRSGTVQSLKCCPCQQKRAARLPSAAPGSIKGGGPETRSGTVQSLKCCPCQQKRGARLPSAAQHQGGGAPKRARAPSRASSAAPASRNEARGSQVLPGSIKGGGPRNALGHRPEPQVLPLPAETRREAPKCCAWQHQGEGPRNALGHRSEPEVLPLPAETSCKGGGPRNALGHRPEPEVLPLPAETRRARAPSRASSAAPARA